MRSESRAIQQLGMAASMPENSAAAAGRKAVSQGTRCRLLTWLRPRQPAKPPARPPARAPPPPPPLLLRRPLPLPILHATTLPTLTHERALCLVLEHPATVPLGRVAHHRQPRDFQRLGLGSGLAGT